MNFDSKGENCPEVPKVKNLSKPNKGEIVDSVNAMSLVSKLKARLNKSEASVSSGDKGETEEFEHGSQDEWDGNDEENYITSDDDEEDDIGSNQEEGGDHSEDDEYEKYPEKSLEKEYEFGEDPESINIMKQKRYADAEAGFYSRFNKKSFQKMIYEDTTEYLNVGPKADFDLANCSIQEVQGKVAEVNLDDSKIKNLFVGGDYADTAKGLLEQDDSEVEDAFGDYEELDKVESGDEKVVGTEAGRDEESKKREEIKKKLKEKFDMEYDHDGGGDDADKSFYTEWKNQAEEQTKVSFD